MDVEKILSAILSKDNELLSKIRFLLWVNFWGPKTSMRELILYEIYPGDSIMALLGFKLEISAIELLSSLVAIETSKDYFVSIKSASKEHWESFLRLVAKREKPRVIVDKAFRENLGLPSELINFEILVLDAFLS